MTKLLNSCDLNVYIDISYVIYYIYIIYVISDIAIIFIHNVIQYII